MKGNESRRVVFGELLLLALVGCSAAPGPKGQAFDASARCLSNDGMTVEFGAPCSCDGVGSTGVWSCRDNGLGTIVGQCRDCRPTCLAEGTLVATPDGERRIETLAVGDLVIAVEPTSGAVEVASVLSIRSDVRETQVLRGDTFELVVTGDHPLFDPGDGAFHPAREWVDGRRSLVMRSGLDWAGIAPVGSHASAGARRVFDLTVAHRWHTFVASGVVVHNKSFAGCVDELGVGVLFDQPCVCDGGLPGFRECVLSLAGPTPATCTRCGLSPDGGTRDAGVDGG